MTVVRAGDYEALTTYGIGLAKRETFRVLTLRHPDRLVVDVRSSFPTVRKKVYFFHQRCYDGIARVQLTGGCSSGGSTVSVAREIMPSLRQFATVDHVKVYDPSGRTESPWGHTDSMPVCLEP